MSCEPALPVLTQILNHPQVDECVFYQNAGPGNYVIRLIGSDPTVCEDFRTKGCFYRRMGDDPEVLIQEALKYLHERFPEHE